MTFLLAPSATTIIGYPLRHKAKVISTSDVVLSLVPPPSFLEVSDRLASLYSFWFEYSTRSDVVPGRVGIKRSHMGEFSAER